MPMQIISALVGDAVGDVDGDAACCTIPPKGIPAHSPIMWPSEGFLGDVVNCERPMGVRGLAS